MKKRIYIWQKIYDRLCANGVKWFEIDIRYLDKWIKLFPNCFPKCMINGNFTAVFNQIKYRWEIWSGKHKIEFNPQNYMR